MKCRYYKSRWIEVILKIFYIVSFIKQVELMIMKDLLSHYLEKIGCCSQNFGYHILAASNQPVGPFAVSQETISYLQKRAALALREAWRIPVWQGEGQPEAFIRTWRQFYFPGQAVPRSMDFIRQLIENIPGMLEIDPWDLLVMSSDPAICKELIQERYVGQNQLVFFVCLKGCLFRVLLHLGKYEPELFLQRFFRLTHDSAGTFYVWEGLTRSDLLTYEMSRMVVSDSCLTSLMAVRHSQQPIFRQLNQIHAGPVCFLMQVKKDLRLIKFLFKNFQPEVFSLENSQVVTVRLRELG